MPPVAMVAPEKPGEGRAVGTGVASSAGGCAASVIAAGVPVWDGLPGAVVGVTLPSLTVAFTPPVSFWVAAGVTIGVTGG